MMPVDAGAARFFAPPRMTRQHILSAGLLLCWAATVGAQTLVLDPLAVTASRAPQPAAQVPFSLVTIDGRELRAAPSGTLDGALRGVPGFSLFRRSDSLTAHPTAQGVSLRGLGPSGASRSLVLLDGVPLNDPFGGWVTWSKVSRESLAGAELVRGGGATAWGNAALGGVVQLLTAPLAPGGWLTATIGDFSTHSAELSLTQAAGPGTLQLTGRDFATDGFSLVAPEDRGPVDIAAWSKHHWLSARWTQPVGEHATLTVTGRTFREKRGNGTAYQRNSSDEDFGSVALTAQSGKNLSWTALAYGQDQSFSSTFSSVNATRTTETPASNQFAVPATALGAAWTGVWTHSGDARTSAGADLRRVRGETREHFTYSNGDFTRQRVAGGTQEFAGLFALHERALAPDWRLTLGARLDGWRETDGHRRETDRATGAVLRDDRYADRDGLEFSPSAGLVWTPAKEWRLRAAAQQAFRRPTLNELYRPFRVGNVITEANAVLDTERVTGGELGIEWSLPPQSDGSPHGTYLPPYPFSRLKLGAAVFWNELRDAVGNVTIARGPGTFPIVGFVPAGGTGRQRLNLDRLRVRGLELTAEWRPGTALSLNAAYLYNDATVQHSGLAPALAGKRLAQVPRHSVVLGAEWRAGKLTLTPRVRVISRQFEDDENQLILGAVAVADLGASYTLGRGELFLMIENLGDARIETGRSADGLVNTGTPRLALAGFRCAW
jgi:outer membrane receptor protein involved in Fe transport